MHLNDDEQLARFRNMLKEYKCLKRSLAEKADEYYNKLSSFKTKQQHVEMKHGDHSLNRARVTLKENEFQIPDSSQIIDNLAKLLAEKKLEGDDLEFNLLCSLIMKVKSRRGDTSSMDQFRALLQGTYEEDFNKFLTELKASSNKNLMPATEFNRPLVSPVFLQNTVQPINQNMNFLIVQHPAYTRPVWGGHPLPPLHANATVGLNAEMLRKFDCKRSQTEIQKAP